jgi:threonine dehydrogenase-like Zn-dependent dehydrogenase
MKAVKAFGPKDLRIIDTPKIPPMPGEVMVAVRACGVCGSDKWYWEVKEPIDMIAGHEAAGEVAAVGEGVSRLKVGDRVAVNNVRGCGHCAACQAGWFTGCTSPIEHMNHGFSEFITIPERNCLLLHEDISCEQGCLIFDNWGTPYAAMKRLTIKTGDFVVVSGCGPIGLAASILARLRGARVFAMDPIAYRREAALQLGAEKAFAPTHDSANELKKLAFGNGVDVVLECSGKPSAYEIALQSIKNGGTLVAIGEGARFELNVSEIMIAKHLNFIGSLYSGIDDGAKVQEMMVNKLFDPLCLVTHKYVLEDLPKVFGDIFECREGLLKTIVVNR